MIRILVSGATGFLGRHVVAELKKHSGKNITVDCLSRTNPDCIRADLTDYDCGLNSDDFKNKYDVFLHMAALYDTRANEADAIKQNVIATRNALSFAQKTCIPHFVHMSSLGVGVGADSVMFFEREYPTHKNFPDPYSKTKAIAETLVVNWKSDAFKSKTIIRPGVLLGCTLKGEIDRIDGIYFAIDALKKMAKVIEKIPGPMPLPGKRTYSTPVIPVDVAAVAIAKIIDYRVHSQDNEVSFFHLSSDGGLNSERMFRFALDKLGFESKKMLFLGSVPERMLKELTKFIVGIPKEEMTYHLRFPQVDMSRTKKLFGDDWCPDFDTYKEVLWDGYQKFVSNR